MTGISNGTGSGRKDYAWLKERYTMLMGRRPEERELARLMKIKDVLAIDYDDPALLHLLAFEYYGQLYEEVPAKIRTVIAETEGHASRHFEQRAADIAEQQAAQFKSASNEAVVKLTETANRMLARIGTEGKTAMSSFLLNEFEKTTKPEFEKAAFEAKQAGVNINDFVRLHLRYMLGCCLLGGVVGAAIVMSMVRLYGW